MDTNTYQVRAHDELRVQAALLRTPEFLAQFDPDKFAGQLERIAAALASAPPSAPEPEVHSYDPTEHRESVTIRWPDGKCLSYVLDRTRYTDNLPPSAPAGVDFAAVASILRRAMRDRAHYGYRREFILQQALALEALSQQPAAVDGLAVLLTLPNWSA